MTAQLNNSVSLSTITVYWRGRIRVTIDVDSRGLSYEFHILKDQDGKWLAPPHTTNEEFTEEFEQDPWWTETRLGQYLTNLMSGDGIS
jgi:hypothetical protein